MILPYKVYIDTPLGIDIFNEYRKILSGDELELFDKVLNWDNLVFVRDPESSKALVHSNEPCVILSTSGMCNNGRIRHHLKKAVPNPNATVLFVGFSTPGSLAALLKDKNVKSISIDNKQCVEDVQVSHSNLLADMLHSANFLITTLLLTQIELYDIMDQKKQS